jgi:hypothetical protein
MVSISLTALLETKFDASDGSLFPQLGVWADTQHRSSKWVHDFTASLRFPESFMQAGPLVVQTVRDPDGPLGRGIQPDRIQPRP